MLVTILSSCNLPAAGRTNKEIPTQTAGMALQINPIQTIVLTVTPPPDLHLTAATLPPEHIPPNTPVWSVYSYNCELAVGGGTMTMNLGWTDHSDSEESYKVYRDGLVVKTLEPNSTYYVDVSYVASGQTISYSIEAFNKKWQTSTSTIVHGCQ